VSEIERKHPLAECERCPWYEKTEYAGESGPEDASMVIVGEAPGAVETRTGEPFTGPSGQLLDRILSHHGFDRGEIRFTNAAACHPPYRPGKGSHVPPPDVISACRPRLRSELAGKETVVLLGNTAAQDFLGTRTGILALRIGPPRTVGTQKVLATVHPAAALRAPDLFPNLVKDIGKLRDSSIWGKWEPPAYKVFDEWEDAVKVIQELHKYDELTVDIEVDVAAVKELNKPGGKLLCIGISYAPGKAIVLGENALQHNRVRFDLKQLLGQKKITCHNGKFDIAKLYEYDLLNNTECFHFDTMLASYTFDERPGYHDLEQVASEMLGSPIWKDEIKPFIDGGGGYGLIPRPILYKYCAYDTANTYLLKDHFEKKYANDPDLRKLHDRLIMYARELIYVEQEGVGFDLDYNAELFDHYAGLLGPLETRIAEMGLINPRSWQQILAWYEREGIKLPNTEAETIRNVLLRRPNQTVREMSTLLLEQKLHQKSMSTYVKGLRKRVYNGRIYSTFNLHGTVTGRTGSRNPNLQNVTRGVTLRKQFIPGPGNVFIQADYGQIELRVAAVESGDPYLISVFRDPSRDIFDELGTALYGSVESARLKEHRVRTKAYVYGAGYGREAQSVADEYKISVAEAERGMNGYFQLVPGLMEWREKIREDLKSAALVTRFHRRRRFGLITRENRMDCVREGWAFIPQSTANDVNLTALTRARRAGMHVRIPVHDSIMVEAEDDVQVREDVRHDLTKIMVDTAAELLGDTVPFTADSEVGYNWGELSDD
jgi:uracil-DNA glycosylase family 4